MGMRRRITLRKPRNLDKRTVWERYLHGRLRGLEAENKRLRSENVRLMMRRSKRVMRWSDLYRGNGPGVP
jgi:hypothetical protein